MENRIGELLRMSVIMGMMASVFITPVFCVLRKIFYVPFTRRRLMKEAVRKGHVVQARLVRERAIYENHPWFGSAASNRQRARYEYEYEGRTYRYSYLTRDTVPDELTLYFHKNPRRACLSRELGMLESRWLFYYVVFSIGMTALFFRSLTNGTGG